MISIAQQIAAALDNDGQCFRTRPTDDRESMTFDDLVEQHGSASIDWRDGFRTGDTYRLTFADESIITVAGSAWDIGFAACFCWEGCPDDDCGEAHTCVEEVGA